MYYSQVRAELYLLWSIAMYGLESHIDIIMYWCVVYIVLGSPISIASFWDIVLLGLYQTYQSHPPLLCLWSTLVVCYGLLQDMRLESHIGTIMCWYKIYIALVLLTLIVSFWVWFSLGCTNLMYKNIIIGIRSSINIMTNHQLSSIHTFEILKALIYSFCLKKNSYDYYCHGPQ